MGRLERMFGVEAVRVRGRYKCVRFLASSDGAEVSALNFGTYSAEGYSYSVSVVTGEVYVGFRLYSDT